MSVINHVDAVITRALETSEARRSFPKLNAFRDCFEAAMDFETALGCSGLSDLPGATQEVLKRQWARWEERFGNGEGA